MSRGSGGLARTALACGAALGVVTLVTLGAVTAARQGETHASEPEAVEAPCPPPGAPGDGEAPLVAFVGDSTTALAAAPTDREPEGAIAAAFADDYRTRVEAQFGGTIGDLLDELEAVLDDPDGPPDVLVLHAGTNDVVQDTTDWPRALDEVLALVEDLPCVLLVTVNEFTDEYLGEASTTASAINARIAAAVTAPNIFHVDWNVDWRREIGFTPEIPHLYSVYAPPEVLSPELRTTYPLGMWVPDGVHQSAEGSIELARRIRLVLDQVSGAAAP
jgi:lysophospholipase L1-like esterase